VSPLPVIDRTDRRRALLTGTLAVALVGLVDVLGSPGGARRLPLWAAWAAGFLALLPLQTRGPAWVAVASGGLASVGSMLTLLAMSWSSGGSHSIFFLILMMVPLMAALIATSDTVDPFLQGVVGLAGGGVLMRLEDRPWSEVLPWATLAGIAIGFALLASLRARRRQDALLRAEQARADALVRLAAAEKARAQAERWVALGQLADEVAHDVNSPLASIRSNLTFLEEELGPGPADAAGAIRDAVDCAERIRVIIARLQARLRLARGSGGGEGDDGGEAGA